MPFGLVNAPAIFQRTMNKILVEAEIEYALVYMDDILIPSKDVDVGMIRLREVLDLLKKGALTLKMSKCNFFLDKIDFLGFEVSANGMRPERPVLALYDPLAETQLHTDASKHGLAGILLQRNVNDVFQLFHISAERLPLKNRITIREEASERIETQQLKDADRFNKRRKRSRKYKVEGLVRIVRQVPHDGQSQKLVVRYQGPYRVIKVLEHDRYVVEDAPLSRKSGRRYEGIVAVDKMQPWMSFDRNFDDSTDDEVSYQRIISSNNNDDNVHNVDDINRDDNVNNASTDI
ncbi:unnamed protein product [Euphydryas editha]|uniref:Reverse transcriptase domain-containing protein n=1 Tax=Euphydryas editha TaxID=104508 RepID=A0AAU9UEZ5_EUPED|nr:unnamed protein product [Euphydryas editha]